MTRMWKAEKLEACDKVVFAIFENKSSFTEAQVQMPILSNTLE